MNFVIQIEALDATVVQGLITHYGPLPVLTCVVQTLLIRKALLSKSKITSAPSLQDIRDLLKGPWKEWQKNTKNPFAREVTLSLIECLL